jgi:hypothetical protein
VSITRPDGAVEVFLRAGHTYRILFRSNI